MSDAHILEMRDIEKSFGGIEVLRKARFSVRAGEVHALMGGNGAGKSTLMKILTGVYQRDAGTLRFNGQERAFAKPLDAEIAGIAMIFQELSLIPSLTVAQNIFLHREPRFGYFLNDREANRRARTILSELGEDIDPAARVGDLTAGASQMVEIAKALSKDARLLVMDEPTSSLSEHEAATLFRIVGQLKRRGIAVVYISHRMSEIFAVCDRVTVLRDGATVLTDDCANVSMGRLIEAMLGSGKRSALQWRDRGAALSPAPALEVRGITRPGHYRDVDFAVHGGEIVGLAGLMGSGRTEIAQAVFGLHPPSSGEIRVAGKPVRRTRDAIEAGVALVPENRRTQGLVLQHSLRDNFMLPNLRRFTAALFMRDGAGTRAASRFIAELGIRTDGPKKVVAFLSGGNQQKVVLAKWLARAPKLLVLDEPTVGVDIGAKAEIVEIVRALANKGTAVLVISSEFEELLAVSDRILVIRDGTLIDNLDRRAIESEEALHHAVQR